MKLIIADILDAALANLPELAEHTSDLQAVSTLERTRDVAHGDFASNIAMRLAKPARMSPRDIAAKIVEQIADDERLDKVEIAGPGFINFHLSASAYHAELAMILEQNVCYGRQEQREYPRILLEFVSANPTGPLHVGHGRHASFGATVGNLLQAAGYPVEREYYVNDAGRQMDILAVSVYLRWLEARDIAISFPDGGYRGEYIRDIAAEIDTSGLEAIERLCDDLPDGNNDEVIDALISRTKETVGEEAFGHIRQQSLESVRADIEEDLAEFGVTFDRWFSEQSLTTEGQIDAALVELEKSGKVYEKDGAKWFRATDFGDEKDRVVERANGTRTYFASDIAYHYDKRLRGFDLLIDVLGADHHGYVSRVGGGLSAMGYAASDLEVPLVQFVALYEGGEKIAMSTRGGKFVTLRQLREEVGNDAARFFYVSTSNNQHLDFDLDIARSKSNDNPVHYIHYAHARICRVFKKLSEKGLSWNEQNAAATMAVLISPLEKALMTRLSRYPEIIELAAENRAPQHLAHYLRDLAADFHAWYNQSDKIIDDPDEVRDARLALCAATRVVIANGLKLLGVSAPETM